MVDVYNLWTKKLFFIFFKYLYQWISKIKTPIIF